jgi:hypothetical protein
MFWTTVTPAAWSQTVTVPATGAPIRLPALGESASDDLSVAAERRVGDQIMRIDSQTVVGRELTFRAVLCPFGHAAAATYFGRAAMISDVPGQEDGAQPLR